MSNDHNDKIAAKKKRVEDVLCEVGYYPKGSGSVTLHISAENKLKTVEIRTLE